MFTLAIAYLSLPVFLVLFTFFSTPFVWLSAIALVVLLFCLLNSQQDTKVYHKIKIRHCWPLLLVALVVTYLCVVSPFDIWDWEKHYAIFNALINKSWPPVVELKEQTYFLRYFTAWYALPSLFAKIFGTQLLTLAIFIWTTAGVFIALLLAFSYLSKTSHLFTVPLMRKLPDKT